MMHLSLKVMARYQSHRMRNVRRLISSVGQTDTVFALSSGPITKSGVSVIRLSGPASLHCAQHLCARHDSNPSDINLQERKASLRRLYCPETGDVLDQSLVLWFPGPRSFTGEDVVELHVHGSRAVIVSLFSALDYLDRTSGSGSRIRPAERGEFTRRAFDNGRMDLTEVEGLADLLDADTALQRKQALRQMDGNMRKTYESWRQELVRCLAHTEAVIDFGDDDREDDVSDAALYALSPRIASLLSDLERHLSDGRRGEMVREGVRIALAGPPNAGKSSLLNALARRPAAIVSPIAGTTRDVVAVRLDLGGVPCTVSDTAGLRADSTDPVELEGIRRAREEFRRAHIKLFVADSSDAASLQSAMHLMKDILQTDSTNDGGADCEAVEEQEGSSSTVSSPTMMVVLNKADLLSGDAGSSIAADALIGDSSNNKSSGSGSSHESMSAVAPQQQQHRISCVSGEGISELETAISTAVKALVESGGGGESPLITRERHRRYVNQCAEHLRMFQGGTLPMDAAAEELRLAMMELGKVTGRVDVEELLDVIFRDFCIGK